MGSRAGSATRASLSSIGELAEEFGFTARALRLYEEKGLISPIRIGNRRAYSDEDRARLEIIAEGKRVGLALDDIREIVEAAGFRQRSGYLRFALQTYRAHLKEMEAQQDELRERLQHLRRLIAELEAGLTADEE